MSSTRNNNPPGGGLTRMAPRFSAGRKLKMGSIELSIGSWNVVAVRNNRWRWRDFDLKESSSSNCAIIDFFENRTRGDLKAVLHRFLISYFSIVVASTLTGYFLVTHLS